MHDLAWLHAALLSARPQAMSALLRHFRDIELAEEAFQEASLRALKSWPEKGPPRDAAAWLIFVGRNAAVDMLRRTRREIALPPEESYSDTGDAETATVEQLDGAAYRDDILRLMFICCHPELPATQQVALALRIVSGLSVGEIARAFLVGESAMEQRITRAKARIGQGAIGFETPGPVERAERLGAVAAMLYLLFNEGYTAAATRANGRADLSGEAIRLTRLLVRLFPAEPEILALLALMLLQQSRLRARFDAQGQGVGLEDQDRSLWDRAAIDEALALIDKALRHARPGPYQLQAAIAAMHARAERAQDTDWSGIAQLYAALERIQPSPVVTLNRAVAVARLEGPEAGLALIEPLGDRLGGYFYFHGARGAFLSQSGRADEAREAFNRAIALAGSAAEAAEIRRHIDRLGRPPGGQTPHS